MTCYMVKKQDLQCTEEDLLERKELDQYGTQTVLIFLFCIGLV